MLHVYSTGYSVCTGYLIMTKQKTVNQPLPNVTATTKQQNSVSDLTQQLAQKYFDLNKAANDAKKLADKARKELHAAMIDEGVTRVEVSGGFIDRFAKESTEIDPLLIKDYLTPDQFRQTASFTKTAVKKFLPDAIIDKCVEVKISKEDVHIRKS